MDKNILASLEIADHEVRLVVGQFFNSRLNILKVERISHGGILNQNITNETVLVEAIKKAIDNASQNLGVSINRVIVVIPDIRIKRVNHQLRMPITGYISDDDIKRAYQEVRSYAIPEGKVLINTLVNRYFVNGIFTRKLPLNEKTSTMTVDGDLYFADAKRSFPYIAVVEKAGLRVIDVVLSDISFGKEASLYERSIDTPIIAFNASDQSLTLSLFYKGRLVETTHLNKGIYTFIEKLYKQYKIPADISRKLLFDNFTLREGHLSDKPAFVWSTRSQTYSVSQKEIVELLDSDMKEFISEVIETASPIFELGPTELIITGEMGYIEDIDKYIERNFELKTQVYTPQTYGVRDVSLGTIIGSFYYYKDQERYRNQSETSVDMKAYQDAVLNVSVVEDESITKKIKHIFFE